MGAAESERARRRIRRREKREGEEGEERMKILTRSIRMAS